MSQPRLLPKPVKFDQGFRARTIVYRYPSGWALRYWYMWLRNRAKSAALKALIFMVPLLFLFTLINFGPSLSDVPGEIAGKISTINMLITLIVAGNVVIIIIRCLRRPIPRGEYF